MFLLCQYSRGSLIDAFQIYLTAGANGYIGQKSELTLNMKNKTEIATWECTLVLPDGVTFLKADISGERYPDGYNAELTTTTNDDGSITIKCEGAGTVAMTDTDGEIATVTVHIANTVNPGDYTVSVINTELTELSESIHKDPTERSMTWALALLPNVLYLTGPNAKPGQTVELALNLNNTDAVAGWVCFLYLPEGIAYKWASLVPDRYPVDEDDEPLFKIYRQTATDDGSIMICAYSNTGRGSVLGYDGSVATISISVPDDCAFGDYDIELKRISLASPVNDASISVSLPVNETSTFVLKVDDPDASTLIFDSNGGSAIESITQKNGSTITPPANPTREGYTFLGWEPAIPETMPEGGLTVTAQWQINQYKLTYFLNDAEYKSYEIDYDTPIIPEPIVKKGMTFSGWDGLPEMMPAHDVTVTGTLSWSEKTIDDVIYQVTDTLNNYAMVRSTVSQYILEADIRSSVEIDGNTYLVNCIGDNAFYDRFQLSFVTIPSSIISIGEYAFCYCAMNTLIIPDNVTSIGTRAFYSCPLVSLTIGKSVTSISSDAFGGNPELETLTINCSTIYDWFNSMSFSKLHIGENVTTIGDRAFLSCYSLTSVTIPDNVTSIGNSAFSGCTGLTSVSLPNSLTSIGEKTFIQCFNLASVTIPKSVTSIGIGAFRDCWGLISIEVETGNITYDSRKNCNAIIETATNTLIAGCQNTVIPDNVTSIDEYAFSRCTGLTSVIIPESVMSIGGYAFYYCTGLTNITSYIKEPYAIDDNVFESIPYETATLFVPAGTVDAYKDTDGWKNFQNIEEIPSTSNIIHFADAGVKALCVANWDTNGDGELDEAETAAVTDIGTVFNGNWTITSFNELQYFTGLTSIGSWAFHGCHGLTSITIPDGVTSIGYNAFEDCYCLTSVTIPKNVTSIDYYAFCGCISLTSITIPESVTSIGYYAFSACDVLTSIKVEEGNTVYDSRENCNAIIETNSNSLLAGCMNTVIPNSVTSICDHAFCNCNGLASITIPESVISIGDNAFIGCGSLTSITIPESVISIGSRAFSHCSGLTSITIPESVTSIGYDVFAWCVVLTSIKVETGNTKYDSRNDCNAIIETATNTLITGCQNTVIPNSVTSIGDYAFNGCTSLTSITIPNSVTSIGWGAFQYCSSLTDVYCYAKNVPETHSEAFDYSSIESATLYVPKGSVESYKAASPWSGFGTIEEIPSVANPDINGDGNVDVADIMAIINLIADDIYLASADLNNDKFVDVGDIMGVINVMMGNYSYSAGVKAISTLTDTEPVTENNDYLTITNEDNIASIQLDNEFEYSAFQMLVTLPDGVDINDVTFNSDRLNGFTKFVKKVNEGQYIIIGFSMDGNVIAGSTGRMLSLSITGNADDNIIISDPIFSIPEAKPYKLRVADSYTTNLQDVQLSQISVRGNTLYVHANSDTTLNIYTVSGALCEQKRLHPGVNTIPLRRGQYIINNQKITISK